MFKSKLHNARGYLLYSEWKTRQHKPFTTIEAISALMHFAMRGEQIPLKLLPHLDQVCNDWEENNQIELQKEETTLHWSNLSSQVKMMMKCGEKRPDAIAMVADKADVEDTTMLKEFKKKRTKAARVEAEELYEANTPKPKGGDHKT